MPDPDPEREQSRRAAEEAGAIGGRRPASADEAKQPVAEGGGGQAEGFEEAERELIEHASHGDQHAARHVIGDAIEEAEGGAAGESGEPDRERSSSRGTPDDSW
jgi:hypothetical protein